MNTQSISDIAQLAINAAAAGRWDESITFNEEIIAMEPTNVQALNRLAFCYLQSNDTTKAKKIYQQVVDMEPTNTIAQKYLSLIKSKVTISPAPVVNGNDFIEEPGKTKSLQLQRLADPDVVLATPIGTACELIAKNHRVNVQTLAAKTYLGALPDDIAFKLLKLLKIGNIYTVFVQATSKKSCTVFIKETFRSEEAKNSPSFTSTAAASSPLLQEDVLLDETPLDTRETGNDEVEMDIEEPEDETTE